jgi:hypothetical protein
MPTIQPFHHRRKKTKLTLELDHDLAEQLKAYAAYYKATFGGDVTLTELIAELARQFMAGDAEFAQVTKPARASSPESAKNCAA